MLPRPGITSCSQVAAIAGRKKPLLLRALTTSYPGSGISKTHLVGKVHCNAAALTDGQVMVMSLATLHTSCTSMLLMPFDVLHVDAIEAL